MSSRTHVRAAIVCSLAVELLVGAAWLTGSGSGTAAPAAATLAALARAPADAPPPNIDALRSEAASGNAFSARQLASTLLDRYDRNNNPDDLYEAVIWVDREWQQFGDADLVARVTTHYCGQRVIRWHMFCNLGE